MIIKHLKSHWLKYLLGILLCILFIFYFFISKLEANSDVSFRKWIGVTVSTSTKVGVQGMRYAQVITIDKQDNKYITLDCCTIQKYDANDNLLWTIGGYGTTSDNKFAYVEYIATDDQGNIYVGDNGWDNVNSHSLPKLKKFDTNGNFLMSFGDYGTADGQIEYIWGIGIEPATGNIYLTNTGSTRNIHVFSPSGTFITKFGSQGDSDGLFQNPSGVTFDREGYVHIVDYSRRYIQKFSTTTHTFISAFN